MSAPASELFPEEGQNYNSYLDVTPDPVVADQNIGVNNQQELAAPAVSDKEMNFQALRQEISKAKEEREYWKGKAEAVSYQQPSPQVEQRVDAYQALDLDDTNDIRKGFDLMRQENQRLREEVRDNLAATQARVQHQDWNSMVTEHVPQLTNKNPIFAEMIKNASNPYEAAYLLAELNAKANTPQPTPQFSGNAQRAMTNSQKPQTLASIGGGGTLSSADYYATMSDKDFMAIAHKNQASI